MDLDTLWANAQQAERLHPQKGTVKNASPAAESKKATRETWTLPENWRSGRILTLIHEESRTVLGNYQEFLHKTYLNSLHTRKLVRVEGPCVSQGLEYITGWIGNEAEEKLQFEPQRWETERDLLLPSLILEHLGVSCQSVLLKICLQSGWIARAELVEHTRFSSVDGKCLLTLPKGVNLLEMMDTAAKVELRKELAL